MNTASRPRQRSFANAYATGTLETTTPIVARIEYSSVFPIHDMNGAFVKTSTKFDQWNGCGQRRAESAWSFDISAVSVMKTNGRRNMIPAAMRMLWSATVTRKRRRRTRAGGLRRTSSALARAALVIAPLRRSAPTCAS